MLLHVDLLKLFLELLLLFYIVNLIVRMAKTKSIITISIIFFLIAALINILQDDLSIPPALTYIPQKEITSKVHLSTKNLRNGKANGWARN